MSNNLICCNCYYEKEYILSEILEYIQPGPYIVSSTDYDDSYITPVLTPGKTFILGYTNDKNGIFKVQNCGVIIFDDFTTASRYVDFDFKVKSSAMKILINKDSNNFNIKYFYYLLQTINVICGTHKRYWISEYSNLKVKIPPKWYQDIVVDYLDILFLKIESIDDYKKNLEDLCYKAKQNILNYYFGENSCYKSYFMNKNKEHLKNFIPSKYIGDGDWVLSENMDPNGDYKLIQLKHIGNNKYLNKPYNTVSKEFINQNNCSIITSGTLLINRLVADRMNCCILPETTCNHITSVDVCWISKNDSIDNEYLMYLLSSPSFQTEVMNKCSGSTRKRISKKNLLDIKVFIHNYEYQLIIKTKIQKIFCLLDSINI